MEQVVTRCVFTVERACGYGFKYEPHPPYTEGKIAFLQGNLPI